MNASNGEVVGGGAPVRRGGGAISMHWLYGAFGLVGKDFVRLCALPLMLWVVMLGLACAGALTDMLNGGSFLVKLGTNYLYQFIVPMVVCSAYLFGFAVAFEEREGGAQSLLQVLPVHPLMFAVSKAVAAVLLCVLLLVLLVATGLLVGGEDTFRSKMFGPDHAFDLNRYGIGPWLLYGVLLSMGLAFGQAGPRHLVVSIFAGPVIFIGYLLLFGAVTGDSNVMSIDKTPDRATTALLGMLLWGGGMAWIFLWRVYRPDANPARGVVEAWEVRGAGRRRQVTRVPNPGRQLMMWPCLLVSAGMFGLIVWAMSERTRGGSNGFMPDVAVGLGLLVGVPSLLVGLTCWSAGERQAAACQLYALPVSRTDLFLRRLRVVLGCAVWMAFVGTLAHVYAADRLTDMDLMMAALILPVALAGVCVPFLLGLFFRMALINLVMSVPVVIVWTVAIVAAYSAIMQYPIFGLGEFFAHAAWVSVVVAGVPSLVAWVAYARSPLLELGEGRRGLIAILLVLLLMGWGALLLMVSPYHLVRMVLG